MNSNIINIFDYIIINFKKKYLILIKKIFSFIIK